MTNNKHEVPCFIEELKPVSLSVKDLMLNLINNKKYYSATGSIIKYDDKFDSEGPFRRGGTSIPSVMFKVIVEKPLVEIRKQLWYLHPMLGVDFVAICRMSDSQRIVIVMTLSEEPGKLQCYDGEVVDLSVTLLDIISIDDMNSEQLQYKLDKFKSTSTFKPS